MLYTPLCAPVVAALRADKKLFLERHAHAGPQQAGEFRIEPVPADAVGQIGVVALRGAEQRQVGAARVAEYASPHEGQEALIAGLQPPDDTTALEPSLELIERFKPDLEPVVKDLEGNATFLSNQKLRQTVGWEHRTSWREHLQEEA